MPKKILVITTGGTIACTKTEQGLTPAFDGNELIQGTDGCVTDILDLFSVDSTDITPSHWIALCREVKKAVGYDGVVVLHGTDTLEYTAAMLAYTCADLGKPIIITGSMLPMADENSDGKRNIGDALRLACDGRLKGVFAVFCGRIIAGHDAVKRHSFCPDAFASFSGNEIGFINENGITVSREITPPPQYPIPEDDGRKVAVIKLSPFMEEIAIPEGYIGAVVESYGAGGVPERLAASLKKLCERMPVIMTTSCNGGADLKTYAVGQRALSCGVYDGREMSTACAAVRLFLMSGNNL